MPPGLLEWARLPGPDAVLTAVRFRARQGFRTEAGALQVALTSAQRREVARLLGTPWDVSGKPVRLEYLAAALAEHGFSVLGFVEALDGAPVVDQRRKRAAEQAAAAAERAAAGALLIDAGIPLACVDGWLADSGLPRPGTGELVELAQRVVRVWQRLPGRTGPPVRLAQLAAALFEDAHALDYSEPLGRAVGRLAALVHQLPRPRRAGRDLRQAWAGVGVRCDGVSSRVLVLNLPVHGDAPVARLAAATPGEPVWIPLRALDGEWSASAGGPVFVCENPTVVEAAADELGAHCPPIVCTDGVASTAALDLLAGLSAEGCGCRVRADVDDNGFVTVEQVLSVVSRVAWWRYDAKTYADHLGIPLPPAGTAPITPADDLAMLRELYASHRAALHEEALLDELMRDLAAAAAW
ncbi:MAG TPA: DUF2399 domain-containing protein [Pseudonocardiaceae bacterium]|nr:DUF2399 domain-containing protein [Pseudonocardiaceae bacterium]